MNKLEISTWNQLVKAKSEYTNLRILVKQYNSEDLKGTQIKIVDYDTNDIYFAGFVTDIESKVIPTTATIPNEIMIRIINNFGFNVEFSMPIVLPERVVTILRGLYEQGFRYIYKDYIPANISPVTQHKYRIYASPEILHRRFDYMISKSPDYVEDEWDWCIPFKTYPIIDLIESGTVNNGNT